MNRRHILSALATAAVCGGMPANQPEMKRRFQSQSEQVHLLELFTSEGCSSCPPAEKWFSSLQGEKGLWTRFVPLAFHVDYWDYLGWKDPYADPAHSVRQRQYAKVWQADTIYTPELVLDGSEWRQRDASILRHPGPAVGTLTLQQEAAGQWTLAFDGNEPRLTMHLALLASGLKSRVLRGENAGHTLMHDFVVLQHSLQTTKTGSARFAAVDKLATAVAAWICRIDSPVPIQAVAGNL